MTGLALAGRESTGGRFDPTVHDAVVAAGYDRSFDRMPEDLAPGPGRLRPLRRRRPPRSGDPRDHASPGTRLDLGGIAKG